MKLLTFQARHFGWAPASCTIPGPLADPSPPSGRVEDAVVVWLHVEPQDVEGRARAFRHTLKHIKWIANKRDLKRVVLHSFAHLGGQSAPPEFAHAFLAELDERLAGTGYATHQTPFGWFCSWDLSVHGDSMAKVWKQI